MAPRDKDTSFARVRVRYSAWLRLIGVDESRIRPRRAQASEAANSDGIRSHDPR